MTESFIYPNFQPVPGIRILRQRKKRVSHTPFVKTDGGKLAAGFDREIKDCTVRSMAIATEIGYNNAHAICRAEGRRDRGGLTTPQITRALQAAAKKHNLRVEEVQKPQAIGSFNKWSKTIHGTLAQVLPQYRTGRYIFISARHAFAVIDGIVHDSFQVGGRHRVETIYKVILPVPASGPTVIIPASQKPTQSQINDLWARLNALEARA